MGFLQKILKKTLIDFIYRNNIKRKEQGWGVTKPDR